MDKAHKDDWHVDQHGKCYACADRDTLMRDVREATKDEKPKLGKHMTMDGRDFRAGPSGLLLPTTARGGA